MSARSVLACVGLLLMGACGGGSGLEHASDKTFFHGQPLDQAGPTEAHDEYVPERLHLELVAGRVTLDAQNVSLGRLMSLLAEESGLVVAPSDSLAESVTLSFDALPLEKALARILSERNYVLEMEPLVVHILNRRVAGDEDVVARLALTDPDKAVRLAVMFELGAGEAPPREFLEIALRDPDPSVRLEAVEAIHRLGADDALPLLQTAFVDADDAVREVAVETLGALDAGDRSLTVLGSALNDPSPIVREEAVYALWQDGSLKAVALLKTALADPHPAIQTLVADRLEAFSR